MKAGNMGGMLPKKWYNGSVKILSVRWARLQAGLRSLVSWIMTSVFHHMEIWEKRLGDLQVLKSLADLVIAAPVMWLKNRTSSNNKKQNKFGCTTTENKVFYLLV